MNPQFHRQNRKTLIDNLGEALIVLAGNTSVQKRADTAYIFSQEANFRYMSGIISPDWRIIIDGKRGESIVVMPEVSDVHQLFDGSLGADEALKLSGADEVIPGAMFLERLRQLRNDYDEVHTLGDDPHGAHYSFVQNPAMESLHAQLKDEFAVVHDCRKIVATLRARKQPEEINVMKRAIQLTAEAFSSAKQKLAHITSEYELEAEFGYMFRRAHAGHAYDPIVATGKNACTLHYVDNAMPLKKGEFVLIDIGAEVDGYAADITRTYAVGDVSERHKQIHAAVESAQQDIIQLLRPGLSVRKYHEQVDGIMKRALISCDLMRNESDEKAYRTYFPHAISHGLGLDVHDPLGAPETFEPGMVLTVEPGIYIHDEGIGVRIEDDILITDDGHENLSQALATSM